MKGDKIQSTTIASKIGFLFNQMLKSINF